MPKQTPKPGVRHAVVPLDAIAPHPLNYREHPREQLERIALSLLRFGQVRSVVLQDGALGSFVAVAGHGVCAAARLIVDGEIDAPAEKRVEFRSLSADIIPAHWTPDAIEGYLIADNLTAQGGADDPIALAQLLQGQLSAGFLLETVGASQDALTQLLEAANGALSVGDDADVPMADDPGKEYESQFAIAVMCASEVEQRAVYARLVEQGYRCKVLVV